MADVQKRSCPVSEDWYCGSCGEWVDGDVNDHNCSGSFRAKRKMAYGFLYGMGQRSLAAALGLQAKEDEAQYEWCSGCSSYVRCGEHHDCPGETGSRRIRSVALAGA